ncbi:hypothetical protein, partial [Xanthomonas theicola]|uniref:hypothetical protein n=1 Tax=Xanthomonas theicola TaxID=56464 RepID=UPI001B80CC54
DNCIVVVLLGFVRLSQDQRELFRPSLEEGIAVDANSSFVFAPGKFSNNDNLSADPDAKLSEITDATNAPQTGWVRRHDLLDEIARWLCDFESNDQRSIWLMCEAGYSKVGDPILEKRPHIFMGNRPFLVIDIEAGHHETLSTVLRWGRSDRFLGVLQEGDMPESPTPASRGFFLCDAFDGDSLILSEFSLTGERKHGNDSMSCPSS